MKEAGEQLDYLSDIDAVTLLNTFVLLIVFTLLFSAEAVSGYVFPLFIYEGMLPPATTPLLVLNCFVGMYLLLPLGTVITKAVRRHIPDCDCLTLGFDWRAASILGVSVLPATPEYLASLYTPQTADGAGLGVEGVTTVVGVVVHLTGDIISIPLVALLQLAGGGVTSHVETALAVLFGIAFWYLTLALVFDVVEQTYASAE